MSKINQNDALVVLTIGDLKKLIKLNRLEELKLFSNFTRSTSVKKRIQKLEKEINSEDIVYEGVSKRNKKKSIRLTLSRQTPDIIKQYIVG